MAFVFGGVQKHLFVNNYSTTLADHLGDCWIWLLVCLCKYLLIPLDIPNIFYVEVPECSHSRCGYTAQSAQTVYHLVRALHLLVYYLWMSPEWTTVCHLTAHNLKALQSSLEVWGYHQRRGRPSLSPLRWGSRYAEVTFKPTPGKHQWYTGWAAKLTYYKLIV